MSLERRMHTKYLELAPEGPRAAVIQRVTEIMRAKADGAFVIRLEAEFPRTETGKVRRELLQTKTDAQLRAMRCNLAQATAPTPAAA